MRGFGGLAVASILPVVICGDRLWRRQSSRLLAGTQTGTEFTMWKGNALTLLADHPMTEAAWETSRNAPTMLEVVRGRSRERKLRLLACACAPYRWSSLVGDDFRRAVMVAEQ